ncbi:MAG: hypothetical protein GY849_01620 [Deltaproteobacteria bacterium]|nr:hypothetical protein [Deltaproteobacteria bacterium]
MKRALILTTFLLLMAKGLYAEDIRVLEQRDVLVLYEARLGSAAEEAAHIYPAVKARLEGVFGWDLALRPTVLLIMNRERFQRMAESPLTVAFAVPRKNLIVIDYSRMNIHPFSLGNTLKHELCHLLLHYHIQGRLLPRWLDEGVCQWVSDGIGDILFDQKRSLLNRAAFRGRFIPLDALKEGFPRQQEALLLAYEESRSFIDHIIARFGKEGLLGVLGQLKGGENVEVAMLKALSMPLEKLEEDWQASLRKKVTWFTYLSYHLYEILFVLMAFITIAAFIKIVLRKRAYAREEEEAGGGFSSP